MLKDLFASEGSEWTGGAEDLSMAPVLSERQPLGDSVYTSRLGATVELEDPPLKSTWNQVSAFDGIVDVYAPFTMSEQNDYGADREPADPWMGIGSPGWREYRPATFAQPGRIGNVPGAIVTPRSVAEKPLAFGGPAADEKPSQLVLFVGAALSAALLFL